MNPDFIKLNRQHAKAAQVYKRSLDRLYEARNKYFIAEAHMKSARRALRDIGKQLSRTKI